MRRHRVADGQDWCDDYFPTLESVASIAFEKSIIALGMEEQLFFLDGTGEVMGDSHLM